jgi:uncharacterized protein GlcG (DUF336 family)
MIFLNKKCSLTLALLTSVIFVASCSGGGSTSGNVGVDNPDADCDGSCVNANSFLTSAEVRRVIAQAVFEAQAQGVNATISVVDRVGNVLAVFRMGDPATREVLVTTSSSTVGGLEGIRLPTNAVPVNIDQLAAISKAVTGAFLSSEGNAFTTRTASQIVQEHFNPGEDNQPGGPLFGVQFSQLGCSDFSQRFDSMSNNVGPKRTPLGLSADAGGLPLFKGGTPVGGVGVLADGVYGADSVISDSDRNIDELIAVAATFGFAAPVDRRAERITVDGKTLRFSDVDFSDISSDPATAPDYDDIDAGVAGDLVVVAGYSDGTIVDGTVFGTPPSGIRADGDINFPGLDAFVFVDNANQLRYPPTAGTSPLIGPLNVTEVQTILQSALSVANRARAQIRRPLSSPARVTISVVDTNGNILGMVRGRDAPVFGADVSLQKARTATLFSSDEPDSAAHFLTSQPDVTYVTFDDVGPVIGQTIVLGDYVTDARRFLMDGTALANGIAFADRSGGNLSRPFYPDGLESGRNGPFSKSNKRDSAGNKFWSVFSSGLQLDLSYNSILGHVFFAAGATMMDVDQGCAGVDADLTNLTFTSTELTARAANGLQIFPGSVPVYRGNQLVGGIGVSGDGVDQDDMIAFLGLHNAGQSLGTINNAPSQIRADTLMPQGVRLRYVQCPQAPFLTGNEEQVCQGK